MSQSAIAAALVSRDYEALRAAIYAELVPTIDADTDPQTWDERELGAAGGARWPAVFWQERLWFRDPDDATTAHDAIACIVTLGASRYKTNDIRFRDAVKSRSVSTPPVSPALGDDYLVPAGADGEWATHEDERALFTARGWQYKPPAIGNVVLVEDEGETGQFIHVDKNEEWQDGLPGNLLALSVQPTHLLVRAWSVEDQTTTAPPAEGPAGEQYIVGPSATGPWAGLDNQLAYRPAANADFFVIPPFVGEEAFDKSLNIRLRWDGAAWVSAAGVWIGVAGPILTAAEISAAQLGSTGYTFSPTTAPTTSNRHGPETVGIDYAAKRAGAWLKLTYRATISGTTEKVIAIKRDDETTFIEWHSFGHQDANSQSHELFFTAPNTDVYTYLPVVLRGAAEVVVLSRRLIMIEELGAVL